MQYAQNAAALKRAVEEHRFIRNIRYHRREDGALDIEGNLRLWEESMNGFIRTELFEDADSYMVFIPSEETGRRGTILIAHGGGFQWRTGCEAGNVAWYFHQQGFNTAILSYRLRPAGRRAGIRDMQQAIRILRSRKEKLGITDAVAVMGFSAGGMLCGNCATHFDEDRRGSASAGAEAESAAGKGENHPAASSVSDRPDAVVIGYGAMSFVSFPPPFAQTELSEADKAFWGETAAERLYLAPEKNIRPDTPPMFLWQTRSEPGMYAMTLAKALEDAEVPYELHIFPEGSHGLGLADGENDLAERNPHVAHWAELCTEWLRMQGI